MKKLASILLFLLSSLQLFGQSGFESLTKDSHGNPKYYRVNSLRSNCRVELWLDEASQWISPFNQVPYDRYGNVVFLKGAKQIGLKTRIHKDSVSYYRYTIIENDSVYLVDNAVPKNISFTWPKHSDFPGYLTIDLAQLNVVGKKVTLQFYKLPRRNNVNTVTIYNKPILPAKFVNCYTIEGSKSNFRTQKPKFLHNSEEIYNKDSTLGLLVKMKNTEANFIYTLVLSRQSGGKTEQVLTSNSWQETSDPVQVISAAYFKKPGKYRVAISAAVTDGYGKVKAFKPADFEFTVKEVRLFSSKELALILLGICAVLGAAVGAMVTYIKKKNNEKLAASDQQKEISKTQLNSIRSQLNPHFMFNALAGIQNLMNSHKIDEANLYLGKFARLTRSVLEQKELVSLAEEKDLLTDYLQMEQLRFGFEYALLIDEVLDIHNIEIPAMLLQPFVENAVKHGIATKENEGKIEVSFFKKELDLVLLVKDNGLGFDAALNYEGLGLQLSKSRISLLNTIFQATPFILEMNSNANGTVIKITLNQWL